MAISESKLKQMNSKSIIRHLETAEKLSERGLVDNVIAILKNARECAKIATEDTVNALNRKEYIIIQRAYLKTINLELDETQKVVDIFREGYPPNPRELLINGYNHLIEAKKYAREGKMIDGKFGIKKKIENLEFSLDYINTASFAGI